MTIPDHLITPLDWSAEALRHAAAWTGQPEGARALVESKRYLAMHEQIERLRRERDELASGMQALRDRENITSGELITGDDLASGMQALRARLAEIERADDLDADIIEAQRAVVQQLASRPACDWPGKCAHKRPAQAAAPERAEPARQELTALERKLLGALQGAYSLAIGHAATYQHQHQLDELHPTHAEILSQSRAAIAKASPAPADAPARADPQPRPTCSSSGLLGATSGVGRECGMLIEGVCTSPDPCQHQQHGEPADPRTPPPGCRLLGDYEPAQAGDMAYIGAIAGRWRRVKPRMGIIGATMDEMSDGGRVLALARPCRCGPDSVPCPRGGAA